MSSKAILQSTTSAIAILGINIIPAGIVLVGGQSADTAMILYFLENILFIFFSAARVRILAPAHDAAYSNTALDFTQIKVRDRIVFRRHAPRDRGTLLAGYLMFSLSFSIGTGVFLFIFLFLILGTNISSTVIMAGMVGIAAFQLFSFGADLFLLGRLSPERAEKLLEHSMGRVALLYLAVIVGVFLALLVEKWFVLPFAVLTTLIDLAVPIQALSGRKQRPKLR